MVLAQVNNIIQRAFPPIRPRKKCYIVHACIDLELQKSSSYADCFILSPAAAFSCSRTETVLAKSMQASVLVTCFSSYGQEDKSDSVCSHRNTVFQARNALWRHALLAFVDEALDHHTCDGGLALSQLFTDADSHTTC